MVKIDFISDINKKFGEALGYAEVDRYMRFVLWSHLAVFSFLVFANTVLKMGERYPNPFAWRVINPTEAVYAMIIAVAAVLIPVMLEKIIKAKSHYLWRIMVTVSLVFFSYLFVFISGGSIEMHFHFFIIAALIVMYADWRLGWILLVLTGLHHGILNYIEPGWVYFYGRNDLSVVTHALPVVVMVIFTTAICEIIRGGIVALDLTNRGYVAEMEEESHKTHLKQG